jgi:hypothetical protein
MATTKIVRATYTFTSAFRIPKGVDLEDKKTVSDWYIKWSVLYITFVNGDELKVKPHYDELECADYKHPDKTEIGEPLYETEKPDEYEEHEEDAEAARILATSHHIVYGSAEHKKALENISKILDEGERNAAHFILYSSVLYDRGYKDSDSDSDSYM